MSPKRTRRNSRKPRILPLAAVNQATRWVLLSGGAAGLTPRLAA